jgi:hypothetical protein
MPQHHQGVTNYGENYGPDDLDRRGPGGKGFLTQSSSDENKTNFASTGIVAGRISTRISTGLFFSSQSSEQHLMRLLFKIV